jgi:RNAse (barnase) inhibitor barstar
MLGRYAKNTTLMQKHRVNGKLLTDWNAFHDFFASTFDFPDYYGRNMDAWNDCMSDYCYSNGLISLHIDNAEEFKKSNSGAFSALVDCSAFINWRATDANDEPLIILSYYI